VNHGRQDRGNAEVAVIHAGLTIYRVFGSGHTNGWSYTTCEECAARPDGTLAPHAFDVRGLPNPGRLDLENGDGSARVSSIGEILRRSTEAGAIAPSRCSQRSYMLDFAVPADTPGSFIRSMFALYGMPRAAADAFLADVSLAIGRGRHDLLISEVRLVENALATAVAGHACDDETHAMLEAELIALLRRGNPALGAPH
jgi:hypothetical protein